MGQTFYETAPRTYVISKSQHVGYGFIVGHDGPTMVRKVEENGPSFGRLQPGDVIMAVNGIDVENVSREQIIKMIQLSGDQVKITVRNMSYRELIRAKNLADPKFYLLNETKKSAPNYGRFSPIPQRCKSSIDGSDKNKKSEENDEQPLLKRRNTMRPFRPPPEVREILKVVIKIFFEDDQTRALQYNPDTTVRAILNKLNERLEKEPESEQVKNYFGLALTVVVESPNRKFKPPRRKLLHMLDENDLIMKIAQLPYSQCLRIYYRLAHPPSDLYGLYKKSKLAFEYFYQQSCKDLILGGGPELSEETALKLSALHLLEYVYSNHPKAHRNSRDPKVYIKLIKKSRGIEYFVPASIAESVLDEDGKRIVSQYKKLKAKLVKQLKKNFEEFNFEPPKVRSTTDINRFSTTSFHELSLPEMQCSPSDYIKLLFLTISTNKCRPDKLETSSQPIEQPDKLETGSHSTEQQEMAATPSIESISSITFNMQNSPSPPQAAPPYLISSGEAYNNNNLTTSATIMANLGPSPMPRLQTLPPRRPDFNSIDKLYNRRYPSRDRCIDDLLRNLVTLPPPPPPSSLMFDDLTYQLASGKVVNYHHLSASMQLTQVLTDKDIEKLRVPPPPKRIS